MARVPAPTSIRIRPRALRAVAWDGRPLGRVCEVLRCRGSGRAWAIVRTGRLRRRRAVPMAGARYEAALVRLPIAADLVRSAPPLVRRDGRLDDRDLRRHYGPLNATSPHLRKRRMASVQTTSRTYLPRTADHPTDVELVAEARATTRGAARTFSIACRMLPRALRDDVYLLYLVFRTLDDLVDDGRPEAAARVEAVASWAAGDPGEATREVAILRALAARHPLPRSALSDFCAGMCQDLRRETFATEADLDRYCYRVAGTVGVVMTSVLGARNLRRAEPAAIALGVAMQRTNILRDIDEDLANGRVFLAEETVTRHGSLAPGRREGLLREQIARADELFEQGLAGVGELRHGGRAIAAAGAMYREILREIERRGYGAVAGRAVVPRRRKLAVAAHAAWRR